jgi:hypothetical protein
MIAIHNIETVHLDQDYIYIVMDGRMMKILISKVSGKLQSANEM